jgi:hypothetical protein
MGSAGAASRVLVFRVSEASATEVIIVASIVVPLVILGIVSWFLLARFPTRPKANG